MELLLIRHGLAGKPDSIRYPNDDLRPLTAKGQKAFRNALEGLLSLGLNPDLILSSPAIRCLQTTKLLAREFHLGPKRIREMPELHHSIPASKALAKLSKLKLPPALILVGHEPWLGEMVSLLISGTPKAGIKITKGGGALLRVAKLKPGGGQLEWLLTQDQLAALA